MRIGFAHLGVHEPHTPLACALDQLEQRADDVQSSERNTLLRHAAAHNHHRT
jgi:hypothetical protein